MKMAGKRIKQVEDSHGVNEKSAMTVKYKKENGVKCKIKLK